MRPFVQSILLLAVLAGCSAPGVPRAGSVGRTVPPPATGSFGAPDAYYNRRPASGAPVPGAAPRATSLGYDDSTIDTLDGGWRATASGQLPNLGGRSATASFDAPVGTGVASQGVGFQPSNADYAIPGNSSSLPPNARGMRVNDGTGFAEPRKFTAAAAREIGRTLGPPEIDFSSAQSADSGGGNAANGASGSGLSFRPPSIRRSNVETPNSATYLR